eukprot:44748-Eustigmatos_ZCMA.PRE.1
MLKGASVTHQWPQDVYQALESPRSTFIYDFTWIWASVIPVPRKLDETKILLKNQENGLEMQARSPPFIFEPQIDVGIFLWMGKVLYELGLDGCEIFAVLTEISVGPTLKHDEDGGMGAVSGL